MTAPAKILIVDDEAPARRRLRDLLDDCREAFPLTIVDEAANGVEAIDIINKGGIEIVLTDIRMPVMDGIEVARHLSKMEVAPKLIFTTAFDEYAVRAFELNAIDYLLKPIKQERLLAALIKARPVVAEQVDAAAVATSARRKHLSIHERGKIVLVPVEDIIFLRAELKYLTVKTIAKEYLLEESLTKLEQEFGELFVRVHRGALVARKAVRGFERGVVGTGEDEEGSGGTQWVVVLNGSDERLTVSRRQHAVMKEF